MSPGTDTIIQGALDRRNLQALFAALPLLRDLDAQLLRPPLESTDMLNWQAFDRVIELGYRHAADSLDKRLAGVTMARPNPATAGGGAAQAT